MLGLVRDRSTYEVKSMVHNPKGCYKKTTKRYSLSICTSFAHFFITLCLTVMYYIPLRSILLSPTNPDYSFIDCQVT